MRYFFDACMSFHLAKGFAEFVKYDKSEAVHLKEVMDESTPDHVWTARLRDEGDWVVISADRMILKNPANKAAWRSSGLTGFFMFDDWPKLQHWKQVETLSSWWTEIHKQARTTPAGASFQLPKSGNKLAPFIFTK